MKQGRRLLAALAALLALACGLGAGVIFMEIFFPGDPGDMQGMIALFGMGLLALGMVPAAAGAILCFFGFRRERNAMAVTGLVFLLGAAAFLDTVALEIIGSWRVRRERAAMHDRPYETLERIVAAHDDRSALEALSRKTDTRVIPLLIVIMEDDSRSPEMRGHAARMLGEINAVSARASLERAAESEDPSVKQGARWALLALDERKALENR